MVKVLLRIKILQIIIQTILHNIKVLERRKQYPCIFIIFHIFLCNTILAKK